MPKKPSASKCAPKRTAFERERDLVITEALYLQGKRQWEIGAQLGVSAPQINYDLNVIRKRWRESTIRDFDAARDRELAKVDELERTYWEAWVKSTADREITTAQRISKGRLGSDKAVRRIEQQGGNPAYLAGVQWCVEKRCKLLGLDAPDKSTVSIVQSFADLALAAQTAE